MLGIHCTIIRKFVQITTQEVRVEKSSNSLVVCYTLWYMQPKKLEHYKYFQPFAWTLCLTFAGFVGIIALNVQNEVKQIQSSSLTMEERLANLEAIVGTTTPKKVQ